MNNLFFQKIRNFRNKKIIKKQKVSKSVKYNKDTHFIINKEVNNL